MRDRAEIYRQRASEMRKLAQKCLAQASNKALSSDIRYMAAVQADHATQLAVDFDELVADAKADARRVK